MDYAERERNPVKHLPSITMVVILHLVLGYALVTGLARKVVEVMKAPIETKIIEEIKKPPPDTPPPPPPKLAPPPPPFIPPPEINIQAPAQIGADDHDGHHDAAASARRRWSWPRPRRSPRCARTTRRR